MYVLYDAKTGESCLFSVADYEKFKKTDELTDVKPVKKGKSKNSQTKPVEGVEDGKDK